MNPVERKAVQELYPDIKKSAIPELVADKLLSKEVLSWRDMDDIRARRLDYDKWGDILALVIKSGKSNVFGIFMEAIENADESLEILAEKIKKKHEELKAEEEQKLSQQCSEGLQIRRDQPQLSMSQPPLSGQSRDQRSNDDCDSARGSDENGNSDNDSGGEDDGEDSDADVRHQPPVMHQHSDQLMLDACPRLLQCKELDIPSKLASEWYTLAVYLGLEDVVDSIDSDYNKVMKKCEHSLSLWIDGKECTHFKEKRTWRSLLRVIKKMYPAFAEELEERF